MENFQKYLQNALNARKRAIADAFEKGEKRARVGEERKAHIDASYNAYQQQTANINGKPVSRETFNKKLPELKSALSSALNDMLTNELRQWATDAMDLKPNHDWNAGSPTDDNVVRKLVEKYTSQYNNFVDHFQSIDSLVDLEQLGLKVPTKPS